MDERDKYRPRTPPVGVRAQTAPPVGVRAQTAPPVGVRTQTAPPLTGIPIETIGEDDLTPLPSSTRAAIEKVDRRVKSATQSNIDITGTMRLELRADIGAVSGRLDDVADQVTQIAGVVGRLEGQVGILITDRAVDRAETSTLRTATTVTELEVHKTRELADIDVDKTRELARIDARRERGKAIREWITKAIAVIATLATAMLASRQC